MTMTHRPSLKWPYPSSNPPRTWCPRPSHSASPPRPPHHQQHQLAARPASRLAFHSARPTRVSEDSDRNQVNRMYLARRPRFSGFRIDLENRIQTRFGVV
uniref:Uncharacterized protein n=1 Tax=Cacopsylla melanoneura TaxID=428564 RepID=A0A8D8XZL1_9HEMI